jgi:hypothetical protein
MLISRRIGSTPQERGSLDNGTCPDIFELADVPPEDNTADRVAFMGTLSTEQEIRQQFPADDRRARYEQRLSVDPGEVAVIIPRQAMLDALPELRALMEAPEQNG